jgi:MFS family permease
VPAIGDAAADRDARVRGRRWCAAFLFFLAPSLLAPVVPGYVLDRFGGGSFGVGLAVAAMSVPGIIGRPIGGRFVDRHGASVVFGAGALVAGVAMGAMAIAPVLVVFLFLRVLQGAGDGLCFVGAAAGSDDGTRGRGVAYTRFAIALTGGSTVGPLLSVLIVDHIGRDAVWPIAGACALVSVAIVASSERPRSARAVIAPSSLVHRPSIVAGVGMGLGNLGFAAMAGFAVLVGAERGMTVPGVLLSAFAVTVNLGRITGSSLPDRLGPARTIRISAWLSAAGLLGAGIAPGTPLLLASVVVLGAGSALLMPALLAEAAASAGDVGRGVVVGTVVGVFDACFAAGAIVLGAVAAAWGDRAAFVVSALAAVACLPVFSWWRSRRSDLCLVPAT